MSSILRPLFTGAEPENLLVKLIKFKDKTPVRKAIMRIIMHTILKYSFLIMGLLHLMTIIKVVHLPMFI